MSCLLSLYRHAPFLTDHAPVGYLSNLAASHHHPTNPQGSVCTRPSGSCKHCLAGNSHSSFAARFTRFLKAVHIRSSNDPNVVFVHTKETRMGNFSNMIPLGSLVVLCAVCVQGEFTPSGPSHRLKHYDRNAVTTGNSGKRRESRQCPIAPACPHILWSSLWTSPLERVQSRMAIGPHHSARSICSGILIALQKQSHSFDSWGNIQQSDTYPMVIVARFIFCDDTELVTNLVTKQKRPTEVGPCCRGIPRL